MNSPNPLGLSERDRGGAFFIYGDDEFRKEEAAQGLVKWHLDPGTRDFNLDLIRGSEASVESLASILATPPMMAEWRVVLLREAEALASSPKAREALLQIVGSPPPGLALIILATIPGKSRAKYYESLKRKTRSVEFRELGAIDVPGWLVEWASSRLGVVVEEAAARALGGALGTELGMLAREVEKLAGMVEEGEPITLEAVERSGTRIPRQDRWAWMDLVGERAYPQALEGLPILIGQGESGVYLTMGLATHLLRLGLVRSGGQRALEEALPHHQKWLSSRLVKQARRWSAEALEEALLGLARVDRTLKSTSLPEENVLEEWLLGLMVREQREGAA